MKKQIERRDHFSEVCEHLSDEFGARFDQTMISTVAAEEIAAFGEARVRDFIPILAFRRARARLSEPMRLASRS